MITKEQILEIAKEELTPIGHHEEHGKYIDGLDCFAERLLKLFCQPEENTPPKLMTVSQYARAKKINLAHKPVSTQAVYVWIKDRKLKTVKVGKITLIVV